MKWFDRDDPKWRQLSERARTVGVVAVMCGGWLLGPLMDKTWRDRVLAGLGALGLLFYFNMGFLHFGNFIHAWDTYHYYVGSKYFPELSYDLLYDCTAVADVEDADSS